MIKNEFTDKKLVAYRKHNYWRGFIVANILWLIGASIFLNILLDKLN